MIVGRGAGSSSPGSSSATTNARARTCGRSSGFSRTAAGRVGDLGDAAVLQPAYQRGNFFQSVHAKLLADAFQRVQGCADADPRLNVKVERESEFFAGQSHRLTKLITDLGSLHRGDDGPGRDLRRAEHDVYRGRGAHARDRHAARTGLRRAPVVISVLVESLMLALIGGPIGGVGPTWL